MDADPRSSPGVSSELQKRYGKEDLRLDNQLHDNSGFGQIEYSIGNASTSINSSGASYFLTSKWTGPTFIVTAIDHIYETFQVDGRDSAGSRIQFRVPIRKDSLQNPILGEGPIISIAGLSIPTPVGSEIRGIAATSASLFVISPQQRLQEFYAFHLTREGWSNSSGDNCWKNDTNLSAAILCLDFTKDNFVQFTVKMN